MSEIPQHQKGEVRAQGSAESGHREFRLLGNTDPEMSVRFAIINLMGRFWRDELIYYFTLDELDALTDCLNAYREARKRAIQGQGELQRLEETEAGGSTR